MNLIRLTCAVLAAGALAGAAAMAAQQAPQGDPVRGKEVFLSVGCWSCHGYEGQGANTGPRLAPGPRPYAIFSTFVRTTSADMPPYTEVVLPEQDLRDIHAYLSTIPPSPDPASTPLLQQLGG